MIRRTMPGFVLLLLVGCAGVDLDPLPSVALLEEKRDPLPEKVIPVWTDTVLHRGGKAVRGFGGRVIFYGEKTDQPIRIDGMVIVYAWDDTGEALRETPDRKYVFKADELSKHYSKSRVGDSYSFWLPWDAVGGPTRHITLITRFVSSAGGEVTSSAAHVVLPGPFEPKTSKRGADKSNRKLSRTPPAVEAAEVRPQQNAPVYPVIQQLTFDQLLVDEQEVSAPAAYPGTTTIELPLHMARQPGQLDIVDLPAAEVPRVSGSNPLPASARVVEPATSRESRGADFGQRQLPVRSWRSEQQSDDRESSGRFRSASRFGEYRRPRSPSLTVQQRIARDAEAARARSAELWESGPAESRPE